MSSHVPYLAVRPDDQFSSEVKTRDPAVNSMADSTVLMASAGAFHARSALNCRKTYSAMAPIPAATGRQPDAEYIVALLDGGDLRGAVCACQSRSNTSSRAGRCAVSVQSWRAVSCLDCGI